MKLLLSTFAGAVSARELIAYVPLEIAQRSDRGMKFKAPLFQIEVKRSEWNLIQQELASIPKPNAAEEIPVDSEHDSQGDGASLSASEYSDQIAASDTSGSPPGSPRGDEQRGMLMTVAGVAADAKTAPATSAFNTQGSSGLFGGGGWGNWGSGNGWTSADQTPPAAAATPPNEASEQPKSPTAEEVRPPSPPQVAPIAAAGSGSSLPPLGVGNEGGITLAPPAMQALGDSRHWADDASSATFVDSADLRSNRGRGGRRGAQSQMSATSWQNVPGFDTVTDATLSSTGTGTDSAMDQSGGSRDNQKTSFLQLGALRTAYQGIGMQLAVMENIYLNVKYKHYSG